MKRLSWCVLAASLSVFGWGCGAPEEEDPTALEQAIRPEPTDQDLKVYTCSCSGHAGTWNYSHSVSLSTGCNDVATYCRGGGDCTGTSRAGGVAVPMPMPHCPF